MRYESDGVEVRNVQILLIGLAGTLRPRSRLPGSNTSARSIRQTLRLLAGSN
jgi:hypothetical protein